MERWDVERWKNSIMKVLQHYVPPDLRIDYVDLERLIYMTINHSDLDDIKSNSTKVLQICEDIVCIVKEIQSIRIIVPKPIDSLIYDRSCTWARSWFIIDNLNSEEHKQEMFKVTCCLKHSDGSNNVKGSRVSDEIGVMAFSKYEACVNGVSEMSKKAPHYTGLIGIWQLYVA